MGNTFSSDVAFSDNIANIQNNLVQVAQHIGIEFKNQDIKNVQLDEKIDQAIATFADLNSTSSEDFLNQLTAFQSFANSNLDYSSEDGIQTKPLFEILQELEGFRNTLKSELEEKIELNKQTAADALVALDGSIRAEFNTRFQNIEATLSSLSARLSAVEAKASVNESNILDIKSIFNAQVSSEGANQAISAFTAARAS